MTSTEQYYNVKRKSKEIKDRTKELRRRKAMESGREITFYKCPLCNKSKSAWQWGRHITPFKVYPNNGWVLIKKGGGRLNAEDLAGLSGVLDIPFKYLKKHCGIGFHTVAGYDPRGVKENFPQIWENLKTEVRKLSRIIDEVE